MRKVAARVILERIVDAIGQISFQLDTDVYHALGKAQQSEPQAISKDILQTLLDNADIATTEHIPLCQDTGTLVVFADYGAELQIEGAVLSDIINDAVSEAYQSNYLRASIVLDPLFERINTRNNCPAIIHTRIVAGDQLTLHIAQKGGGAENMSVLRMLKPGTDPQEIVDLVCTTVQQAGGNPCPPLIIGVGIGGNFESCAILAKRALFVPLNQANPDVRYAVLEQQILTAVNASGVGPQGLGGATTALAVHILFAPCHIASLPVAINLQCHSHRHCEIVI